MTLTKHQRYYRRLKKKSKTDMSFAKSEAGKTTVRVNRKKVCARVSQDAYDRLTVEAERLGISAQDLLTRMILQEIPRYCTHSTSIGTDRYYWDKTPKGKRRDKTGGQQQLNLWVSSTAWRKLECHRNRTGFSKARIIQSVILGYRFITEAEKQRNEEYKNRVYVPNFLPLP